MMNNDSTFKRNSSIISQAKIESHLDLSSSDESVEEKPKEIKTDEKFIEINVIDPMTKKKETFKCDKQVLCSKMKFFDLYNKEALKTH